MPTFAELITKYIQRAGISDAELARKIGVRRQTIFRWKEGLVARPRSQKDVTRCAKTLRLTQAEQNELLISAGFRPDAQPSQLLSDGMEQESKGAEVGMAEAVLTELPPIHATQTTAQTAEISQASPLVGSVEVQKGQSSELLPDLESKRSLASWFPILLGLVVMVVLSTVWISASVQSRPISTPTSTGTVTSPTASPTATPIVAAEGETLLLIAKFANYTSDVGFNVAGRIQQALADEIEEAELDKTKAVILQEHLIDEERASAVLSETKASMIIWGEYDSGRVQVNFAINAKRAVPEWVRWLNSPDELSTTINIEVREEVRLLALMTLGRLYRDEKRYDNAQAAFERALALEPEAEDTQATLHFDLGYAYEHGQSANLDKAIAQYTASLRLRPQSLTAQYNRGTAYLHRYSESTNGTADLDKAIIDFDRIVRIRPTYMQAFINRGIAHYQRNGEGDISAAIQDFTKAIELEPDSYRGYFNRGLAHIRVGNSESWQVDLNTAQQVEPERASIYNALCWGYVLDQKPNEALAQCNQALALNPELGSVHDSMGISYALLGQYEEAIVEFEAYVAWLKMQSEARFTLYNGPLVEEWIALLKQGENPISTEVLETLRL